MRLVRFSPGDLPRLGALVDGSVVDLSAAAKSLGKPVPDAGDLRSLVEAGPAAWAALEEIVAAAAQQLDSSWAWPTDQVRLHHPYRPRKNVIRAGANVPRPEGPLAPAAVTLPPGRWLKGFPIAYYTKAPSAVADPGEPISWPLRVARQVYAEPQLAIVVGKPIHYASSDEALASVFGYAVATDVASLDLKIKHGQWPKAVSLDSFFPWGPTIVTRDEVPDADALEIRLELNGEECISGSTANTVLSIGEMLAEISTGILLEPGDVLLLGTPEVVGFGREPARWLQAGDTVTSTIETVGSISNVVEPIG